ncbi:MAG: hypothetical protein ACYTG7_16950 [Planctomycetota bacterium]
MIPRAAIGSKRFNELAIAGLLVAVLFACAGVRPIPVPAGGPTALPEDVLLEAGGGKELDDPEASALLEGIARFRGLAMEIGDGLWPGWSPGALPVAVKFADDRWLLVNHEDPPPGMELVAQRRMSCLVFQGALGRDAAQDGVYPMRGKMTAMVVSMIDARSADAMESFVAMLFQLSAFHCLESSHAFISLQSISGVTDTSSLWLSAEKRAMLRLEVRTLQQAFHGAEQQGCLEALNAFLVLRRERYARSTPFQIEREKRLEEGEGMALYLGFRAMELAAERAQSSTESDRDGERMSLDGYIGLARRAEKNRSMMLEETMRKGSAMGPAVHYIAGMVQAFLLDRLVPDWKEQLMADPSLSLADLVERGLGMHSYSWEDLPLNDVLDRYDYYTLLEEENRQSMRVVIDAMIRI